MDDEKKAGTPEVDVRDLKLPWILGATCFPGLCSDGVVGKPPTIVAREPEFGDVASYYERAGGGVGRAWAKLGAVVVYATIDELLDYTRRQYEAVLGLIADTEPALLAKYVKADAVIRSTAYGRDGAQVAPLGKPGSADALDRVADAFERADRLAASAGGEAA